MIIFLDNDVKLYAVRFFILVAIFMDVMDLISNQIKSVALDLTYTKEMILYPSWSYIRSPLPLPIFISAINKQ